MKIIKSKRSSQKFTLRQLRNRGWRRLLFGSVVAAVVTQFVVLAILSGIGFGAYEPGGGPSRQWYLAEPSGGWVYRHPTEPILIPFDQYAENGIVVGTRIVGMPYFQPTHGEAVEISPVAGPALLVRSYTPQDDQQVYQFVEDRIGFPMHAARSVFVLESSSSVKSFRERWVVYKGIELAGESGSSSLQLPREFVAIPLKPMYFGFLMNLLFYAIPYIVFVFSVRLIRLIRARSRAKQGECVSCRYTLAGLSQCPECGMDMQTEWKKAALAGCKLRHLPRLMR